MRSSQTSYGKETFIVSYVARCFLVTATFFALSIAQAAEPETCLTADPGFDEAQTGRLGAWEVRYVRRMKVPTTRPNWKAEVANNPTDPAQGPHLYLRETAQASGTVYVGQVVRLPDGVAPLEVSFDYQTYCAVEKRCGLVRVVAMAPEVWRAIPTDPAGGAKPDTVKTVLSVGVQKQGDDVTEWKRARVSPRQLGRLTGEFPGREVAIAIEWTGWHHTSEEWARFDNIRLGAPAPDVRLGQVAAYAQRNRALGVEIVAHGAAPGGVRIEYRPASGGAWQSATAHKTAPGLFMGRVPAQAVVAPLEVRAAMQVDGEESKMTETASVKMTEPRKQHPCLFYTPKTIEDCKRRIERYDWARCYYAGQKAEADRWLERDDEPPLAKAGWSHDYVCPECGLRLTFREDHPHKHLCEKCNKEWEGPKLDRFWNLRVHGIFSHAAAACALAYQIEGDEKHAKRAIRIVDWYSRNYPKFTSADSRPGKGGRLFTQSLAESSWLVGMMELTDLVYPAMSEEERWRFENQLVRPCAEHVYTYTHGIHNIQCWKNAALGVAGYLLNAPDMIDRALNHPELGFRKQIDEGVLPDGMWYERSMGYHNYCLMAINKLVVPALHAGTDLRRYGRLPMMYTAPLQFVQPNFWPPALNDMGYTAKPISPTMLEYAMAWYDDEDAARAAGYLYGKGFDRAHKIALRWGEEIPDLGKPRQPDSADMPGMGLAVLRHGAGDEAIYAALEYGEHGGGHGHPDKMQLILYGLGRPLATDLGTTGYGIDMHWKYYKTTPGHNTVAIGTKDQQPTTGKCLAFEADERCASAVVESREAYPGYRLVRRALAADGLVVDVFDVIGSKKDTLDWFARAPGPLTLSISTGPLDEKPPAPAYAYFEELQGANTDKAWQARWQQDAQGDAPAGTLVLTMGAQPATQVARAVAPGPRGYKWDTLRVRRQAATTRFVAVWQMTQGEAPKVEFSDDTVRVGPMRVSLQGPVDSLLRLETAR